MSKLADHPNEYIIGKDDNACMNQHLIDAMVCLDKIRPDLKGVRRHLRYIAEHLDGEV